MPQLRRLRWVAVVVSVSVGAAALCAGPEPTLRQLDGGVAVLGLADSTLERLRALAPDDSAWLGYFTVKTADPRAEPTRHDAERPAVLGSYSVVQAEVRFTPRFPWVPGQPYEAVWMEPGQATRILVFEIPRPEVIPTTEVLAIWPSGEVVPENLLRFYIQFSAPMARGQLTRRLRLETDDGDVVPGPFVAPEHELWNPAGDRLTVFLDPGRIKRGVGPNVEVGPPLREGLRYRLKVESGWQDAHGQPLREAAQKEFRVAEPDRRSPRLGRWRLEPPSADSTTLWVHFDEPMDHALIQRWVQVVDSRGRRVEGHAAMGSRELGWTFEPDRPWRPGFYAVQIGATVEDLAGNTPDRLFEIETTPDVSPKPQRQRPYRLPFQIAEGLAP